VPVAAALLAAAACCIWALARVLRLLLLFVEDGEIVLRCASSARMLGVGGPVGGPGLQPKIGLPTPHTPQSGQIMVC